MIMEKSSVMYRTINIDGVNIFYREAGSRSKPAIVLLNGVPNSSSAFQQLTIQLKDEFYLVTPDFPGFGNSDTPDQSTYQYTFNNISLTIEKFIDKLGLS